MRIQATLRLSKPGEAPVRLDAALAAQRPDHLRLRAWKFNRVVLDITRTPAGVWVLGSDRIPADVTGLIVDGLGRDLARFWDVTPQHASDIILVTPASQQPADSNRTPAAAADAAATAQAKLSRFRIVDGHWAPMHIKASSAAGGSLQLDVTRITFDDDLPASLFMPPEHAQQRNMP